MKTMYKHKKTYLLLITFVSAMGGLLFGYDWVVIGGAKIFYEPFFGLDGSAAMRGWAMSSALIGCLVGALLAGLWSDKYGRKKMLIIAAALFSISAYGTGAVDNFTWFIIYRILGGFGIGIASNISPIYIAEVSPASVRGRFVSLNQLTIVLGILAAQIVNWQIGDYYMPDKNVLSPDGVEWAWRWMFWAELVPALIFFVLAFIIPESPRWLVVNQKKSAAHNVFAKIGGEKYADAEMLEIEKTAGNQEKTDWKALFQPNVRKVLIIGIVLAIFQQWCGINVIFNYAHEIFSAAGYAVSDVLMNIVVTGVTNVIFTFVAIYTVDRWGRRALMFVGSAGLAIIYIILGSCYYFGITGLPMLLLVVLAIACYAMSLAPIVWVVLSEIFPTRIRGAAMAVATFFLWVASFVLTYTFPIMNETLGASGTFWIYGGICVAGFLFIRSQLPETKGKTLEEIENELTK
ncbi:sugar porter family MFS transporter [Bacteroides sp. 519]|uniref:sugar porter family MFS transporter n=1 Tax=Bacteroides sp. 519 TaxID=2302937 RepID=UPI00351A270B